jgi:ribosome-associated protein
VKRAASDKPSKTRRKREAETLQALGEALAGLPDETLSTLDLPERLRHALKEYGRISSHEARRRQRQFIGRLMRDVDPVPLRETLAASQQPDREETRLFHLAEHWRDRLLADGEEALRAFLAEHAAAAPEDFGEAVAAARAGRSGASRRLFRMIRAVLADAPGPSQQRGALLE